MPKNHEECLALVCVLCLQKSGVSGRKFDDTKKETFTRKLCIKYYKFAEHLPTSICSNCRVILTSHEPANVEKLKQSGKEPRKFPVEFTGEDYEDFASKVIEEKNKQQPCECVCCTIAKAKLHSPHGWVKKKLGRPEKPEQPEKIPACPECWGDDTPGHPCGNRQKLKNVSEAVSPRSLGMMASDWFKKKAVEQIDGLVEIMGKYRQIKI